MAEHINVAFERTPLPIAIGVSSAEIAAGEIRSRSMELPRLYIGRSSPYNKNAIGYSGDDQGTYLRWRFSTYGMSEIKDKKLRFAVIAAFLSKIMPHLTVDRDPRFTVSRVHLNMNLTDVREFDAICLSPSIKLEEVYKQW